MDDDYSQRVRDCYGLTLGGMALEAAAALMEVNPRDIERIRHPKLIGPEPSPATIAERAAEVRSAWSVDEHIRRANCDNGGGDYYDARVEPAARFWAEQRKAARLAGRRAG